MTSVVVVLWCCYDVVVLLWCCGVVVVLWCCCDVVVVLLEGVDLLSFKSQLKKKKGHENLLSIFFSFYHVMFLQFHLFFFLVGGGERKKK